MAVQPGNGKLLLQRKCGLSDTKPCVPGNAEYKVERNVYREICRRFRILCRTREQADRTLIAVTQWLKERLRLDVSPEKTRVVDVRRSYSEFLGFKIRLRKRGKSTSFNRTCAIKHTKG